MGQQCNGHEGMTFLVMLVFVMCCVIVFGLSKVREDLKKLDQKIQCTEDVNGRGR